MQTNSNISAAARKNYHENLAATQEKPKGLQMPNLSNRGGENNKGIDISKKSVSTSPMSVKNSLKFQGRANGGSRSKSNLNKSLNSNIPTMKADTAVLTNRNINSSSSNPGELQKSIHTLPEYLKQKQTSLSPGHGNLQTITEVVKGQSNAKKNVKNNQKLKNTNVNSGYQSYLSQASQLSNMIVVAKPMKLTPSSSSNEIKPKEAEKRKTPHVPVVNTIPESMTLSYQPSIQNNNNPNTYKYYVGGGNNGELVKRIMKTRPWWSETSQSNTLFNFKWQQTKQGYKYERLIPNQMYKQLVNHFEYHKEITTKSGLIKNLAQHCEQIKSQLFDITPVTFVLELDSEECEGYLDSFLQFFYQNMPSGMKKPENVKKAILEFKRKVKNMITGVSSDRKQSNLVYSKPKFHKSFSDGNSYMWLLKPTGLNRGRGIQIFNTLEQLEKYLIDFYDGFIEKSLKKSETKENSGSEEEAANEKLGEKEAPVEKKLEKQDNPDQTEENKPAPQQQEPVGKDSPKKNAPEKPVRSGSILVKNDNNKAQAEQAKQETGCFLKTQSFIIQKYIERPLLINSRKFDFRVWVLVTHNLELYFFKEGYIRTSSEVFKVDSSQINNYFIHLTNNAVQKYSDNYGQFEFGNQLSFNNFQDFLKINHDGFDFRGKVLPKMKEYITLSMSSVKKKLNPEDRKFVFEIFGYDFIMDADFNLWLIEVNTNPCIEEASPLLEKLLPRMLDDAFRMTLDVLFPKIRFPNNNNSENSRSSQLPIINSAQTIKAIYLPQQLKAKTVLSQPLKKRDKTPSKMESSEKKAEGPIENQNENKENLKSEEASEMTMSTNRAQTNDTTPIMSASTISRNDVESIQLEKSENSNDFKETKLPVIPEIKRESPFPVEGYSAEENMWEFLAALNPVKPTPSKGGKK